MMTLPRLFRQPRLTIVGAGDVGTRLQQYLQSRVRVYSLSRSRMSLLPNPSATALTMDLDNYAHCKRMAALARWVVYLAPPPNVGDSDPRLQHWMCALKYRKAKLRTKSKIRFSYVSTTGVYGQANGGWVNEASPLLPTTPRGTRRLSAEKTLRAMSLPKLQSKVRISSAILRAPGIYAHNAAVVGEAVRLPLERLKNGTPALLDSEDSYSNHIHADDLARLAWRALFRRQAALRGGNLRGGNASKGWGGRAFNACDGEPLKMGAYFDAVAAATGLPPPPRVSKVFAQATVSPMQWSFMQDSRKISNARLAELNMRLQYPNVAAALNLLRSEENK